jgi:hypothetical protein
VTVDSPPDVLVQASTADARGFAESTSPIQSAPGTTVGVPARAVRRARRSTVAGGGSERATPEAFRRSVVVLASALLAVVLVVGGPRALARVGDGGAFSTNVAVQVPGFHGIEPSIALNYDSTSPNGLVGVGWRLDAGSYITRAGRHGGAPRFDGTDVFDTRDVFMLDGEELVRLRAPLRDRRYETRRRDFSRISFDGTRWTRWRPDGTKLVYEPLKLADAKGIYRWALSTVTDTHGNRVEYRHDCDQSECYLESIAYADGPKECFGLRGRSAAARVPRVRGFASTTRAGRPGQLWHRRSAGGHQEASEDDRGADGGRAGAGVRTGLRDEPEHRRFAVALGAD